MIGYKLELEEIAEFDPVMPVQLFSRAFKDQRPIFLTDELLIKLAQMPPEELADLIVEDLRHGNECSSDSLRLYYMLMDFNDFNRMMILAANNKGRNKNFWEFSDQSDN